jgi:curved DNA-binding protein CbpA
MKWQPTAYCFSFGSLLASAVAGVFSPFCRKRTSPRSDSFDTGGRRVVVSKRRKAEERMPDEDRISQAMRQWTAVRADVDLALHHTPRPAPLPEVAANPVFQAPVVIQEPVMEETEPVITQFSMPDEPPVAKPDDQAEAESKTIAEPNPFLNVDFTGAPNFYEILQISARADLETIHRVYRIMAARFHPDNPVSGDHEMFLKLCEAYDVLSKPERRALYDQALRMREAEPIPAFGNRIFVDGLDAELNRRFGILALLYLRRRTNSGNMGISTLELEVRMSLPREHLEFTLWYLRNKGYVQILEANSDYAITTVGVDYVESKSGRNQILRDLLAAGCPTSRRAPEPPKFRSKTARQSESCSVVSV